MSRNENRSELPPTPAVSPTLDRAYIESLEETLRLAKEAYQNAKDRKRVQFQAQKYKHNSSKTVRTGHPREQGEVMHYISMVKQEPGVAVPVKRKTPEEVIDLCDSDSDSIEGDSPELPLAQLPDKQQEEDASGGCRGDSSRGRPRNRDRSSGRHAPRASIVLAKATRCPERFWYYNYSSQTTTIVESTTSAHPPATAGTTGHTKGKTKKRTPKPAPEHPHKYRGPELNVLSLQAIWDHLDRAWKQASCNVTNIGQLQSWWNTGAITATYQLSKHQVWLLLFAQSKWWQALEEQWTKFDALPDKNRMVILKMRGVRLRKESDAIKAESALVNDGIMKNSDAVYMLGTGVKKEKVDEKVLKKKDDGMKRTRSGTLDTDVQKEGEGVQHKRVKFGSEEMANKGAGKGNKGTAENNESDDGLSSDSDEEEEED